MLDQLSRMPLATTANSGPDVDEIPGLGFSVAKCRMHSVMEKWKEFLEEAGPALGRKAVVETPHSRAELGQIVVHVLPWWHPSLVSVTKELVRLLEAVSLIAEVKATTT